MSSGGITFVCPAMEEGSHIEKTLTELYDVFSAQDYAFEMICIDDGSKDNTYEGILAFAEGRPEVTPIRLVRNRGIGYAVRRGYAIAKMDYVMFVPTNGMLDPTSMFDKLGDRGPDKILLFEVENIGERPLHRKLPSATYHFMMTRLLGIRCAYVHSMALLPRAAVVLEHLDADRSFHMVEVLALALRRWGLTPIVRNNRIKRGVGIQKSKSFKLNNVTEILLFVSRLRRRLDGD